MNPAVASLAATLYQQLTDLSAEPLAGSGPELTELGQQWLDRALYALHAFLSLHREELDEEWTTMIDHTATMAAWLNYQS
jgi:hypothetical protein